MLSVVDQISERNAKMAARWLFLIGLGSQTQIYIGGYTAITEFVLIAILPWMVLKKFRLFSRDCCSTILYLLMLWMVGVCATDISVGNSLPFFIRGFIAPLGIFATLLTVYPLLKRNPEGLRWFLFGAAISGVICIYAFQKGSIVGSATVMSGEMTASEATKSYKLFGVSQLNTWLGLPVQGWYMNIPVAVSVLIGIVLSGFSLWTGGRSAFLGVFLSTILIFICGHSVKKMAGIRRHGLLIIVALLVLMPVVKIIYKEAAVSGWMGEEELRKYEVQAKGKNVFETLASGRGDFFISLDAIWDKPVMGHGSYALDTKGYMLDYARKHSDDYETIKQIENIEKLFGVRTIPAHSHITCFWMWAGIPGLLPWLYIIYLLWVTLFKRSYVYPSYFGYFALVVPSMFWHIFFSPFGGRIDMGVLIATCLVVQTMERERQLRK